MDGRVVVLMAALFLPAAYSGGTPGTSGRQQPQSVVYVCPMHPALKSSKPGRCTKCGMTLVDKKAESTESGAAKPKAPANQNAAAASVAPSGQDSAGAASVSQAGQVKVNPQTPNQSDQNAEAWTCPMHPYLRLDSPGKCPKCGMTLVPANPSVLAKYNMDLRVSPEIVRPGENIKLTFGFYEPDSGKPVTEFSPTHSKLFHLFVISQDMTSFEHIHPELESDGTFSIETVLPGPGLYKIYADVYPTAGTPQVLQTNIVTTGYQADLFAALPHLVADKVFSKVVDGMKVDVTFNPEEILDGEPIDIKFHLTDAKTGKPVTGLHPYLGAWGHMLLLSADGVDYVHSHPSEMVPENVDASTLHGGPDVVFNAMLPEPGVYRMWTQFQRGAKLITVSFDVRAAELQ